MRKLNILKAVLDFLWITSMPIILMITIAIPFVFLTFNKIGILLIIFAVINELPTLIYKIYYRYSSEVYLSFSLFILTLSIGLFFMILSEVFKITKKIKQENELTI